MSSGHTELTTMFRQSWRVGIMVESGRVEALHQRYKPISGIFDSVSHEVGRISIVYRPKRTDYQIELRWF